MLKSLLIQVVNLYTIPTTMVHSWFIGKGCVCYLLTTCKQVGVGSKKNQFS
jgi:hypothetical protein